MAKTNTEPLSGIRDFLPLDVLRRSCPVIGIVGTRLRSYGFEPLQTPTLERLSTLLGKYGEEGDQLIFRVLKSGDKLEKALADHPTQESVSDAGLRYDLTVPLAGECGGRIPRQVAALLQALPNSACFHADHPAPWPL